jgi:hypothetical protein
MLYTILYLDKSMAFNITNFRSSFENYEPASPTNYEVTVVRPPRLYILSNTDTSTESNFSFQDLNLEDKLKYRCISCSLPGKMMSTTERATYGPTRKVATGAVYQDVVFSFIVSDSMEESNYFNNWQQAIVYNNSDEGRFSNDVAYYDDYIGTLNIRQFSKNGGDPILTIQLLECYPISVEEIPIGWEMNNEFIKVNVTMAYRNWKSELN